MSHQYAQYSTADFDKFDCLKLSKGIFVLLLFVLRGYLVWLMTITNMKDRVGIIQWIYPDPTFFYLSLVSGLFGLYVLIIISLRRPDASQWVRKSWQNIRFLLLSSLLFDLLINAVGYLYWQLHSPAWLVMNAMLVVAFTWYLFSNKRLSINITEFPDNLPEK